MPPAAPLTRHASPLATLIQLGLRNVPRLLGLVRDSPGTAGAHAPRVLAKREVESGSTEFIVFACLIPILVLLSGLFAGLTLGCVCFDTARAHGTPLTATGDSLMSLDETQLNVLSISGTPYVCPWRLRVLLSIYAALGNNNTTRARSSRSARTATSSSSPSSLRT
jgi:hypothetical protein